VYRNTIRNLLTAKSHKYIHSYGLQHTNLAVLLKQILTAPRAVQQKLKHVCGRP